MRRTSSTRSIRIHPSQNRRCTVVTEKFQSQNVQTFGYVHQSTNGLNHSPVWKIQSFLLNEICTVTFWQDYHGKRHSRNFYLITVGEKFQIENVYSLTEKKGLFLSVYVDDIKLAGKKQNINPTWKIHMKDVDLGEPTSFLDHVYLGRTQRECQISKDTVDNYRNMFKSRISAGVKEKTTSFRENGCEYFLMVL